MSMLSEVISDGCLDKVTVVLLNVLLMLPGDTALSVELTKTIQMYIGTLTGEATGI